MSRDARARVFAYLVKEFIDDVNVPPRPWIVLGEPSIEELEAAFSKFPEFDDMVTEGVLISTRVFDAEHDPTNVVGFVNGIQIEGIGSTPEEAVANTLSGVEFGSLEDMQKRADAVFDPFYEALGVGVRKPEKEKGIFLKTDSKGKVVISDQYRNVDMASTRSRAHRWREDMVELQRTVTFNYLQEVIKRQKVVEKALQQYTTALRRAGRLEVATRASEQSRQAAASMKEAAEARQEAAKYAKLLRGLSIVQGIIGAASIVNSHFERAAQKKAMDSLKSDLGSAKAKIGYLESSISGLANDISDMHRSLKVEIDSIAPSNTLIIFNNSIQIDFSDDALPLESGPLP
ncbi:MAG: hypothetical protein WBA67_06850 [Jannaschia sp.]